MTLLSVLLALHLTATPPPDEATSRAREVFKTAQRLYKEKRYRDAIAKFEEVYTLKASPNVLFNIGKCHEQLGDMPKALRAYRDYVRLAPEAKDKDAVTDAIANLERKLKDRGIQQLLVFADPANATIEVDGKTVGPSPASVELTAGSHRMVVKANGYETTERTFVMQLQRAVEMTINLRPQTEPPITPTAPEPPAVSTEIRTEPVAEKPQPVVISTPKPSPSPGVRPRLWTWVAGGTAIAALGTGIGLGLGAQGAARSLTGATTPFSREEANRLVASANGLNTASTVAYITAGTALAAAIVLFLLEGR